MFTFTLIFILLVKVNRQKFKNKLQYKICCKKTDWQASFCNISIQPEYCLKKKVLQTRKKKPIFQLLNTEFCYLVLFEWTLSLLIIIILKVVVGQTITSLYYNCRDCFCNCLAMWVLHLKYNRNFSFLI